MMPDLATRVVTRQTHVMQRMEAELVVFGAGISGVSAALEAARLGRRVALIDGGRASAASRSAPSSALSAAFIATGRILIRSHTALPMILV